MTYPSKSLNLLEIILDKLGILLRMKAVKLWPSVQADIIVHTRDIVDFNFVFDTSAQHSPACRSIAIVLSIVEIGHVADYQAGAVHGGEHSL